MERTAGVHSHAERLWCLIPLESLWKQLMILLSLHIATLTLTEKKKADVTQLASRQAECTESLNLGYPTKCYNILWFQAPTTSIQSMSWIFERDWETTQKTISRWYDPNENDKTKPQFQVGHCSFEGVFLRHQSNCFTYLPPLQTREGIPYALSITAIPKCE